MAVLDLALIAVGVLLVALALAGGSIGLALRLLRRALGRRR